MEGTDPGIQMDEVLQVYLRECKKTDKKYVSEVMRAFSDLLGSAAQVPDCWGEVWQLCQTHLVKEEEEKKEGEEVAEKKQEMFMIESDVQVRS
jgi:hypothetical protein